MALNDVKIVKKTGGLKRRSPSEDGISGLVMHGVAVAGKVVLGTSYQLKSVTDAEDLGLDAAYDTANDVLVHYHISEFFRMNPDGELWILVAAQATAFADLADPTKTFGKKLLTDAGGTIRQLAIAFNPASGYVPTLLDGLDSQVFGAIAQAQLLAEEQQDIEHAPVVIIIEGREFNGTAAAAKDLRTLDASNVSVMIGSDAAVAADFPKHAAVGTLLGAVSRAKVNESVSYVQKFNAADINLDKFTGIALSSDLAVSSYSQSSLATLNDKGYIFLRNLTGISGAYFNDSPTCALVTDDFATIENNRTFNKAHRLIRTALLPRLGSPLLVDQDTGKLQPEVAKDFEALGRAALDDMSREQEVSGFDVNVDENQDVLATSLLKVDFELTPTGTARTIEASIGFVNPF